MARINFQNLPNTTTPVNATNLNSMQDLELTTGTELATEQIIDTKRVYHKRLYESFLPNNTYYDYDSGLSNVTIIKCEATSYDTNGDVYCIPYVGSALSDNIGIKWIANTNKVRITTGTNRNSFVCYIDLYYTKNL